MTLLIPAFIPAAGSSSFAARRHSPARVSTRPSRPSAARWRLMTSSSGPPGGAGNDKPASTSLESTTKTTSTTPAGAADEYSFDPEEMMERVKDVASDVSERPFFYSKIAGYGVGAIVLLTVLRAVVSAIDSLPVVPAALELIGLGYAAWFIWRYVLFRESRAELLEEIDDFLGRTRPRSGSD